MEEEKPDLENLSGSVRDYIETRLELGKLQAIQKGTQAAGGLAVGLILFLIFLIVVLFFSLALAYAAADWFGKTSSGFLVVGAIYLILAILIYVKRDSWIKKPIITSMLRAFFNDQPKN